jgi:hypothetical protein
LDFFIPQGLKAIIEELCKAFTPEKLENYIFVCLSSNDDPESLRKRNEDKKVRENIINKKILEFR